MSWVGPKLGGQDPWNAGGGRGVDEAALQILWGVGGQGDDEDVLALQGGLEERAGSVVALADLDGGWKCAGAVVSRDCRDVEFPGFEEGGDDDGA